MPRRQSRRHESTPHTMNTRMYVQSIYSIYKVWISPLINTKITIGVQRIVYEALCNCAMVICGYFTSIFVVVEIAQRVKAQVYGKKYGKETRFRVRCPMDKNKIFLFQLNQI